MGVRFMNTWLTFLIRSNWNSYWLSVLANDVDLFHFEKWNCRLFCEQSRFGFCQKLPRKIINSLFPRNKHSVCSVFQSLRGGEHNQVTPSWLQLLRLFSSVVLVTVYREHRWGHRLQPEPGEQVDGQHRGALSHAARQTGQSLQIHR